jgi:hypothetical protein
MRIGCSSRYPTRSNIIESHEALQEGYLEGTLCHSIFKYLSFKRGRLLCLLFKSGRDLTFMSLHLLFRNGNDLMSIYKHKVSLAPKKFLLLPPFDLPIFGLMIRFALCSTVFHSHGWWTFPQYVGLSCHLFLGPLFWECPCLVGSLSNTKHPCFFFWRIFTKIRPEKCDFDQYKVFFMGKMVQIFQILENKKFK